MKNKISSQKTVDRFTVHEQRITDNRKQTTENR